MACAWATLAAYSGMMILSYFWGQKYFPINYNVRAMTVYAALSLGLYLISLTYAGMESLPIKILLNNLLIGIFVWVIYKLEINNLKKLNSDVDPAFKSNQ